MEQGLFLPFLETLSKLRIIVPPGKTLLAEKRMRKTKIVQFVPKFSNPPPKKNVGAPLVYSISNFICLSYIDLIQKYAMKV